MRVVELFEKLPTSVKTILILGLVFGLTGMIGYIGNKVFV